MGTIILSIIGILVLGFILLLIFIFSGPKLVPDNADALIDEYMAEPIPDLLPGESGFAKNGDVSIFYEIRGKRADAKGTILLVMGHSSSAFLWPEHLIRPFLDAGYQVIRYDNRGLGESDWIKGWRASNAYTLEDMAKDGMAILDKEGIDKAHIFGVSMGGMIAQRMAISHSDRVASLTSVMSSGYMMDPDVEPVHPRFQKELIRNILKFMVVGGTRNTIKFTMCILHMLRGEADYDLGYREAALRTRFEASRGRKFNRNVGRQHTAAIAKSGSRLKELEELNVPTLVIHGRKDPLVIPRHAEVYAPRIPNAEMLWIDNMGHDLNALNTPEMTSAALRNFGRVVPTLA